ncbi:MAG TPA: methylenetetrahydrofolate reductase [NAD(P)H] [Candidatus Omnitrophota bacterium]|nr:methylenetetrahydrofolate reductase [NAD(P)H] [Candidatus Omnitrophota bacterium]HQB12533.1 methylenetetrahydrofolate reductase [NAD(P)H] [Candidatus Omnitrophota bacterium]
MRISSFYQTGRPAISFEFFPPKTPEGEQKLYASVAELKELKPSFVSVTYGAMGNTQANTLRVVTEIQNRIGIETAAHLTCVAHSRDEIAGILGKLAEAHIENIVALRGDPPQGETEFRPAPDGFRYASELVSFIRSHRVYGRAFDLVVAGYPEGHPECRDLGKDLEHLKIKVDSGADVINTQLFFNNRDYFRFVERARKAGIRIPIVPGIMPVTYGPQIEKFSRMCGAKIPLEIREAIEKFGDDQSSILRFGIDYAIRQCRELLAEGAPGLHFYTLNQSCATREIYTHLGLPR